MTEVKIHGLKYINIYVHNWTQPHRQPYRFNRHKLTLTTDNTKDLNGTTDTALSPMTLAFYFFISETCTEDLEKCYE